MKLVNYPIQLYIVLIIKLLLLEKQKVIKIYIYKYIYKNIRQPQKKNYSEVMNSGRYCSSLAYVVELDRI